MPLKLADRHPDRRKQQAIQGFMEHGTVSGGCAVAGISRDTWYAWCYADPVFARMVSEAREHIVDQLESTAQRRATDTKKGSDFLLKFLLQSYRRDVFSEKHPIDLVHPDVKIRVDKTLDLIASRAHWDCPAEELMALFSNIWGQ